MKREAQLTAPSRHGWACPGHPRRPVTRRFHILLAPERLGVGAACKLNHVDGRGKTCDKRKKKRKKRPKTTWKSATKLFVSCFWANSVQRLSPAFAWPEQSSK